MPRRHLALRGRKRSKSGALLRCFRAGRKGKLLAPQQPATGNVDKSRGRVSRPPGLFLRHSLPETMEPDSPGTCLAPRRRLPPARLRRLSPFAPSFGAVTAHGRAFLFSYEGLGDSNRWISNDLSPLLSSPEQSEAFVYAVSCGQSVRAIRNVDERSVWDVSTNIRSSGALNRVRPSRSAVDRESEEQKLERSLS